MQPKRYIKIILPLRLEWEPCYYVSGEVSTGQRVVVNFAGKRTIGVVSDTVVTPDIDPARIHPVLSIESGLDPVSPHEIELWKFIADYYLCTIGEVYKAAYPSQKTYSEESRARRIERQKALEAHAIEIWQQRISRLQTRLDAKTADLERKHNDTERARIEEQRKGIIAELQEAKNRLASLSGSLGITDDYSPLHANIPDCNMEDCLKKALSSGKPVLLRSAGTDRINLYVQAASHALRKGRNVCILVNETAIAGQINDSLRNSFGDLLLTYNSQMTPEARRRVSEAIRSGRPYILAGTRSAIFLPHDNLGLIIVENEESPFYKQSDSAPRYNARDCAVQLSRIHACSIILGSVSPSLESIYNARSGRYFMLDRQPHGTTAGYTLVDIQKEKKKNGMQGPFSIKLLDAMKRSRSTALIRGFEKPEDLEGIDAQILTIPQAAKTDMSRFTLTAILNADALFNPADFRSDEHAFQYLERMRSICPRFIVQTRQAAHQVFSLKTAEPLLEERKIFSLPPYTRMIEFRLHKTSKVSELGKALSTAGFSPMVLNSSVRIVLARDKNLLESKKRLRKAVEAFRSSSKTDVIADVDPV